MGTHNFQVKYNLGASITLKDHHELASFNFSGQIISHNLLLIFCPLVINIPTNPSASGPMHIPGRLSTSPHITLCSRFIIIWPLLDRQQIL